MQKVSYVLFAAFMAFMAMMALRGVGQGVNDVLSQATQTLKK